MSSEKSGADSKSKDGQGEKMAALGRLVAGIAHELNNPINFVYGNLEFLRDYTEALIKLVNDIRKLPLSDANKKAINALADAADFSGIAGDAPKLVTGMHTGIERTASIVSDLSVYARQDDQRRDTNIEEDIRTTLLLLKPQLNEQIDVQVQFSDDFPKVQCSAGRLSQVFMNLIANAIFAVGEKGRISIQGQRKGKSQVRIEVKDSGKGMSKEEIAKVFEPFFTTKSVGRGTGLGLWIAKNTVESHEGSLTCESVLGGGSSFFVDLPINSSLSESD